MERDRVGQSWILTDEQCGIFRVDITQKYADTRQWIMAERWARSVPSIIMWRNRGNSGKSGEDRRSGE
jgi:hypothetical protein